MFVGQLSPRKRTMATNGTSTRLPVGGMPGSIQSIRTCVGELEDHFIDELIGPNSS